MGAPMNDVRVERDDDTVTLAFGDALIQSRMNTDDPTALDLAYSQVAMAFTMFVPKPQHILMLGLGGGSMVRHLLHHFPQAKLTVVELDPNVIALRETFLLPPDGDRFKVVCGDGAAFIHASLPFEYDVIVVDAFDEAGQPEVTSTMAFYKACRSALKDSGVLLVNLLDAEPLCSRLIGRIWQVFGESVLPLEVECGGNRIVLAASDAVFRACATDLRTRWSQLLPVHREMLDGLPEVLEEELEPWMPKVRATATRSGARHSGQSSGNRGGQRKRR